MLAAWRPYQLEPVGNVANWSNLATSPTYATWQRRQAAKVFSLGKLAAFPNRKHFPMTMTELFTELNQRGLTVHRAGDELECRGDLSLLTDELRATLHEHRNEFLRLLPRPMSADEIEVALRDLVELLNREMPSGYRLSCNEEFWRDHRRDVNRFGETGDPNALEKIKADALAEFREFEHMATYPCDKCAEPWPTCDCQWDFLLIPKNPLS